MLPASYQIPGTDIRTEDGSITRFSTEVGEAYHNRIGAYYESQKVYVEPSQLYQRTLKNNELWLLDPYFGMGYNSFTAIVDFVTSVRDKNLKLPKLNIVAIEMDPEILKTVPDVLTQYDETLPDDFKNAFAHKIYYQTHPDTPEYEQEPYLYWESELISFTLWVGDTRKMIQTIPQYQFDLLYHDAFSTLKQPELWTVELFKHYKNVLNPIKGSVITYSQSAAMRGSLLEAGFNLYQQITPDNIRGGTIATIKPADLLPSNWELMPEDAIVLIDSKAGIPLRDNETLTLTSTEILKVRDEEHQTSKRMTSSQAHKKIKSKI